ncbi:MAG: hypothetical protein IJJ22_03050 [Oscillospiraceae bacterium]|nr:hypothetical protein [Oscillospiraceae bacterium]
MIHTLSHDGTLVVKVQFTKLIAGLSQEPLGILPPSRIISSLMSRKLMTVVILAPTFCCFPVIFFLKILVNITIFASCEIGAARDLA